MSDLPNERSALLEPMDPSRSVTLNADVDDASYDSLMDPAHKALADALRFTYLLLRVAMVGLALLFVLSGVQRVRSGEEGISLRFGEVVRKGLQPGPHFSWPYPIGELLKVSTGVQRLEMNNQFFPSLDESQERDFAARGAEALSMMNAPLDPGLDGYVLTADESIGHLRWEVTYSRTDPTKTLESIHPSAERPIVQAAISRGVVQASARMTIDEIYRGTPDASRPEGSFRSIEEITKDLAQDMLDGLDSGITIDALSLTSRMPPRSVIDDFNSVTQANEDAGKARADANAEREGRLTAAAGLAAGTILEQIDRYDVQLIAGDPEAIRTRDIINQLLLGESVDIDGERVTLTVTGRAATMLQEAEQARSSIRNRAKQDAAIFAAKKSSFDANPFVAIHTDWSTALGSLLSSPNVRTMMIPAGQSVILINPDPEIEARLERERGRQRTKDAEDRRRRELNDQRYQRKLEETGSLTG